MPRVGLGWGQNRAASRTIICLIFKLGDPSRNIQYSRKWKIKYVPQLPSTILDITLDIKVSYLVERLLAEGEGKVGKVMISESGISRKAGWEKQSWRYKRKDHACLCPRRPYLPILTPLGYWQNGCGQVICLKVYISQVESWKVSIWRQAV